MSTQTDNFGHLVIHGFRNPTLYLLNRLFKPETPSNETDTRVTEVVTKLTTEDRTFLLSAVTRILDDGITTFLQAVDNAATDQNGLEVVYNRKPLSTGDFEFGRDLESWHKKFAHHDKSGCPNGEALE